MPLDVESVRALLGQREVVWLESTASTMADASRLAAAGCAAGAAVVADEQTAGHGRHGRSWHSEKQTGLYVSIVLRPELPAESLPVLVLALGLATREAILDSTGIVCTLKWPNAVFAGGRKCAGILTQKVAGAVIAGIGVNVNQEAFPAELEALATSLKLVSGREHSREKLLVHLLAAADKYTDLLREAGCGRIIGLYSGAAEKGTGHAAGARCR